MTVVVQPTAEREQPRRQRHGAVNHQGLAKIPPGPADYARRRALAYSDAETAVRPHGHTLSHCPYPLYPTQAAGDPIREGASGRGHLRAA